MRKPQLKPSKKIRLSKLTNINNPNHAMLSGAPVPGERLIISAHFS